MRGIYYKKTPSLAMCQSHQTLKQQTKPDPDYDSYSYTVRGKKTRHTKKTLSAAAKTPAARGAITPFNVHDTHAVNNAKVLMKQQLRTAVSALKTIAGIMGN